MCVCVHTFVYLCVRVHTSVCICLHLHTCVYVCMCSHICVYLCPCSHLFASVYLFASSHMCVSVCACVHTSVCICVLVYSHICVCMRVCAYKPCPLAGLRPVYIGQLAETEPVNAGRVSVAVDRFCGAAVGNLERLAHLLVQLEVGDGAPELRGCNTTHNILVCNTEEIHKWNGRLKNKMHFYLEHGIEHQK